MTMKKLIYIALLIVAAGCTKNELIDDNGVNVPATTTRTLSSFIATMEEANTRTLLIDGKQVVWQEDDVILVSAKENSSMKDFETFELAEGVGTTSAKFVGKALTGEEFYAFSSYDYKKWNSVDNLTINWDYESNVFFGNESEEEFHQIPMIAKEKDGVFEFKQLGGILHFPVIGAGRLEKVSLISNDGKPFKEYYKVDVSSDIPSITEDESYDACFSSINRYPYNPIELSTEETTDIYFILPAGMTFEEGLTLSVTFVDEDYVQVVGSKSSQEKIVVNRKKVKHFPVIDTSALAMEAEH